MKRKSSKIVAIAAAGLFGASTLASANLLPAPTNVVCPVVNNVIQANWDDVVGATKYSVDIVATYDTGVIGNPTDNSTVDWDFGTGDRTDGFPISQSDLMIPLSALQYDFGTGLLSPIAVQLRVKGLRPGKNQGRQDNLFSDFCTVPLPPPA